MKNSIRSFISMPIRAKIVCLWFLLYALSSTVVANSQLSLSGTVLLMALLLWLTYGLMVSSLLAWLIAWILQGVATFLCAIAFLIMLLFLPVNSTNFIAILSLAVVLCIQIFVFNYLNGKEARALYKVPNPDQAAL